MSEQAEGGGGEQTPEPGAGSTEQAQNAPTDSASVQSEVPPPISVTDASQDDNKPNAQPPQTGEKLNATGSDVGDGVPKRESETVGPVLDLDGIITKLLAYKERPGKQVLS